MSRPQSRTRSPIAEIVDHLGIPPATLERLREVGLFEEELLDPHEAEELRVAVVLVEELGVNAAGVQVALHLRRRLIALEGRAARLADHVRGEKRPR